MEERLRLQKPELTGEDKAVNEDKLSRMLGFQVSLFLLLNLALSSAKLSRDDFPVDFVFGSGTSAYQVEGAAFEDGRTPSIWDTFAHSGIVHGDGDVASGQYYKYKEDVQLMVDTGLDAYRFSISWPRLIPNGRGPVNPKGLQYYNNLINELISHGIQPHVTIHHSDLPQVLEDEYGGWLSRNIVRDFTAFANVCFREFGDRVLYWSTINEANVFTLGGYDAGITPPQRCSSPFGFKNCTKGNSSTEPYIVAHNLLLAHASAARLYKHNYQARQHGFIGINIFAYWFIPLTSKTEDVLATQRANDFYVGWIVDPLVLGDYPETMKKNVGTRIPVFTEHESELVKGSFDFLGVNHYTATRIKDNPSSLKMDIRDFNADVAVQMIGVSNVGTPDGFPNVPSGLQGVLEYFKQQYGNPPIYIHENGQRTQRGPSLNDTSRVEYLHSYIESLLDAVKNGSNVRGYFTWSFIDVYELLDGYDTSFGLYYVDSEDPDLKRYPKLSAKWYSSFLKGKRISLDEVAISQAHYSH